MAETVVYKSKKNELQEQDIKFSECVHSLRDIINASRKWAVEKEIPYNEFVIQNLNEYITLKNYRQLIKTETDIVTQKFLKSMDDALMPVATQKMAEQVNENLTKNKKKKGFFK